jgi:predicted deacylase
VHRIVIALALIACHPPATAPRPHLPLITTAESSHWIRTGHYDEAVQLCHDFARAYADVTCDEIGKTVEDRPIVALRIARQHAQPVPLVYVQAGIHAGEIEGKDAGLWFLRDLLDGKVAPGALDVVDVVFVPVVNPDGHERFGPNNRPNQRGPEEMGFRTNAARLNINRDFVKAETPEVQALLRVLTKRDPVLLVDLHTTDGAKFEQDISFTTAPVAARPDELDESAHALLSALVARMTALGHLPVGF